MIDKPPSARVRVDNDVDESCLLGMDSLEWSDIDKHCPRLDGEVGSVRVHNLDGAHGQDAGAINLDLGRNLAAAGVGEALHCKVRAQARRHDLVRHTRATSEPVLRGSCRCQGVAAELRGVD